MKNQLLLVTLLTNIFLFSCQKEIANDYEYTTEQKSASIRFTRKYQDSIKTYLNFDPNNIKNSDDYKNAIKDSLTSISGGKIYKKGHEGDNSYVVYDMMQYNFLDSLYTPEANPSLWRQSKLNKINGLFKVTDSIYQIRGFDLANMSLIRGEKGWIVVDPLGSPETAAAGLDLANNHLKFYDANPTGKTVSAVIFTHSHIDHFGGIEGIMEHALDNIDIYVPKGFFEESISENVMGGNAMGRRASYMYGNVIDKNNKGTLGTGLGQTTSTGVAGILDGTIIIDESNGSKLPPVDGVSIEFIYTPEAEAPAEMMFYLTDLNSFCQAEEINHTLHNLYTLRGAKVRNGQKWSQYIDKVIQKWGSNVKVSFGSHHWPTWGKDNINSLWENQRDLYRFIHDQTLRLANLGQTPIEIAEQLKLPKTIDKVFANRGYYGSVSHNARAQYQLYFGWFDGNPANLNKLTPSDAGKKYVEFMGGAENLLLKSLETFRKGEYRWTAQVLNHLVFAEPENDNARYLLADTYEQLGYQAESGPWRNFYLSGAKELRSDIDPGEGVETAKTAGPDMIEGMSNELLFNYLAMCFDGLDEGAADMKYKFQIIFKDQFSHPKNKNVGLIVQNGVVTPRVDYNFSNNQIAVDETIEMTRADLNNFISGEISDIGNIITIKDGSNNNVTIANSDFIKFTKKLQKLGESFWFNIIKP